MFPFAKAAEPRFEGLGLRNRDGRSGRPYFFFGYSQGGPASVVKVLLSENQLFTAIEGAP
jgi:hypothetical protein